MVIDNVFGLNGTRRDEAATPHLFVRIVSTIAGQFARIWCGLHGHFIMLHFEPNKLSLQCSLCGYETEGWEVGRPMTARPLGPRHPGHFPRPAPHAASAAHQRATGVLKRPYG